MTDEILRSKDLLEDLCDEGELSDEELEIPLHMIPPNPEDCDALPCRVHPSYPYGDPTSLNHPAALSRAERDPASRALYEDIMIYAGGGRAPIIAALRWKELALDQLLPIDEEKAEAERTAEARTTASGNAPQNSSGSGSSEDGDGDGDGDQNTEDNTGQVEQEDE